MQTKWGAALALGVIGAISAGVYLLTPRAAAVDPVVTQREWVEVRSWTGVDGPVGRPVFGGGLDGGRLTTAKAARDVLDRWGDAVPVLDVGALPAGYRAEIDRILAWGAAPRFEGSCADKSIFPLGLHDRLRIALATATADDVARAKQVLAVASALKARGSLILTLIGASISREVVGWAKSRGVAPWPALEAAGLDARDYVRAMAREAICSDAMVVGAAGGEDGAQMLGVEKSRRDAHARLAPLQITEPTFERLRAVLEPPPEDEGSPLQAALRINQQTMLDRFEKEARQFAEALAAAR